MLKDIENAAHAEVRWLLGLHALEGGPMARAFKSEKQARRTLRIEIGYEVESQLMEELWRADALPHDWRSRHEGPLKIVGIDAYVVERLPAPGWRVINPFKES